jgi:hypothetical protein
MAQNQGGYPIGLIKDDCQAVVIFSANVRKRNNQILLQDRESIASYVHIRS